MRTCHVPGCDRRVHSRNMCTGHRQRHARGERGEHLARPFRYSRSRQRSVADRFWEKVEKRGPLECWPFRAGGVTRSGHRMISVDGTMKGVHRISWELHHGEIPADQVVCHRCDNPPCVNPAHLFLGTIAVNNADRDMKGRHVPLPGEANGQAKLTSADVREIRDMLSKKVPQRRIAQKFGVHQSLICLINTGKAWSHV
jgi:hypothetical protein